MSSPDDLDELARTASEHWLHVDSPSLDTDLVQRLYDSWRGNSQAIAALEVSGYLDAYLWPLYPSSSTATHPHLMSIALLCNEKCRQHLPIFATLSSEPTRFQSFIEHLFSSVYMNSSSSIDDLVILVNFLAHIYRHLENVEIRKNCMKYVSLPLWETLSQTRLNSEFESLPQLKFHLDKYLEAKQSDHQLSTAKEAPLTKKRRKGKKTEETFPEQSPKCIPEGLFMPYLMDRFFECINAFSENDSSALKFILKFTELTYDLLTQIPTRRFWNTFLDGKL